MDRKTIYVSSKNRTSGTTDDFIIEDDRERFTNTPLSIKAKSITIPFMWNNITAGVGGNNNFSFTGFVSGPHTFVIPVGNYTGATLAKELAKQLNIATGGGSCSGGYTVTYDITTGKYTFTSLTETFSIDFTIPDSMANILGFDAVVTPFALSHTSTGVASILPDYDIWVCTDLISGIDNGVCNLTGNPPSSEQMGVLACVPITTCFGSIIHYVVPDEFPFYTIVNSNFTVAQPRSSRYYLRFPSGAPLSLNGNDWSMQMLWDFNQ